MGLFDKLKKNAGIAAINPMGGILKTVLDQSKGKETGEHGQGARDLGMDEYMQAIKDYEQKGNNQYSWLEDFKGGPALGNTEMGKIAVDPRYSQYEQGALRDLEQQSKDGLSARDLADMAKLEGDVNRQNNGRIGAIQQGMSARGMGGSGMELVAQMQAAQDATERQALASIEKNAQVQQGRRDATAQLGNMSGQLSARDYQQQAQKAAAQDAINRFNNANQWNQNQINFQGRQGIANQNVAQNNQFQQNVLGAQQGGAQMRYNSGVEADNRAAMRAQGNKAQMSGMLGAAGAIGGGIIGSSAGPAGTVAGAGVGQAVGGAAGNMFYSDKNLKENIKPESDLDMEAFLKAISPKEFNYKGDSTPRSGVLAQDLERSKIGQRMVTETPEGKAIDVASAVSGLLQAVAHLEKTKKSK